MSTEPNYGCIPFVLDSSDFSLAINMGILRSDIQIENSDRNSRFYGFVNDGGDNVGLNVYGSQKAAQNRCKEYALQCGFKL